MTTCTPSQVSTEVWGAWSFKSLPRTSPQRVLDMSQELFCACHYPCLPIKTWGRGKNILKYNEIIMTW
jgi:hypothetical protein